MTRPSILAIMALVAATGTTTGPAAADHGKRAGLMFQDIDANGDGEVTRAEFDAARSARFAETDANADGLLQRDELLAAFTERASERRKRKAERRVTRMIDRLDQNGDGAISIEERGAGRADRIFARLDADDDGVISAEEAKKLRKRGRRDHHRRDHDAQQDE